VGGEVNTIAQRKRALCKGVIVIVWSRTMSRADAWNSQAG
jgi:hypothetical protein